MEKIFTAKNIISLIVTAGVGKVIDDAIDATAPAEVQLPAKILRKIGSWSLGWFVGDWAGEKAEQAYDTIESSVKEVVGKVKEVSATVNEETSVSEDTETEEEPDISTSVFEVVG